MTQEQILGFIRHGLTLFGGIFITNGVLDEAMLGEIVGALMTLIGFGWSFIAKKKENSEG